MQVLGSAPERGQQAALRRRDPEEPLPTGPPGGDAEGHRGRRQGHPIPMRQRQIEGVYICNLLVYTCARNTFEECSNILNQLYRVNQWSFFITGNACFLQNRGYAFVEYESHRQASAARRKLYPSRLLWGHTEVKVRCSDGGMQGQLDRLFGYI